VVVLTTLVAAELELGEMEKVQVALALGLVMVGQGFK
jgi:hypothetical protein